MGGGSGGGGGGSARPRFCVGDWQYCCVVLGSANHIVESTIEWSGVEWSGVEWVCCMCAARISVFSPSLALLEPFLSLDEGITMSTQHSNE